MDLTFDIQEQSISVTRTNGWAGNYYRNEYNSFSPGMYTLSGVFSGMEPRHLIFLYDSYSNKITDSTIQIPNFTYNTYYGAWYSGSSTVTTTIPDTISFWKYENAYPGASGTVGTASKIQITKGPIASSYITNDSIVVKQNSHTLHAIWEVAS